MQLLFGQLEPTDIATLVVARVEKLFRGSHLRVGLVVCVVMMLLGATGNSQMIVKQVLL
jgi:hypothetical protein